MSEILSVDGSSSDKVGKENFLRSIWESFKSLDRFSQGFIVFTILLIIGTPFIVSNYLDLRQRAAVEPDYLQVSRNTSTRNNVEQQISDVCYLDGDASDCVTNVNDPPRGPDVWDVDDHAEATERSGDAKIEIPLWGDRGAHVWWYTYCISKKFNPTMQITFDAVTTGPDYTRIIPPGKTWVSGRFNCASGCITGPSYENQSSLPIVPHQGGEGVTLGHAIDTIVRFQMNNVPIRYAKFSAGADLQSSQTYGNYCGYTGPISGSGGTGTEYIDWLSSRSCERVVEGSYSAKFCW